MKALVTYFKQSGFISRLDCSLKQATNTRWNSHLTLLKPYQKSQKQVYDVRLEKKSLRKLNDIDSKIVDKMVNFLEMFATCTEKLSAEKVPTIRTAGLWMYRIKQHLEEQENDSAELRLMKQEGNIWYSEYLDLPAIYYVACMLHPQ